MTRRRYRRPPRAVNEVAAVALTLAALWAWARPHIPHGDYAVVLLAGAAIGATLDRTARAALTRAGHALTRAGRS